MSRPKVTVTLPPVEAEDFTALAERLRREARQEGFLHGLELGMSQPLKPSGHCPELDCHGPLKWAAPPEWCGCRDCVCEKCGKVCCSPCFACDYAG